MKEDNYRNTLKSEKGDTIIPHIKADEIKNKAAGKFVKGNN